MSELELVGLHEDGEHLRLHGPDGQTFMLPITEALRAAVRRDRASLEQWRAASTSAASPREIQSRLRAGASAQEVAEAAGVPVEHVRRFEGPVVAEQEYVVARLRSTPTVSPAPERSGRGADDVPTLAERIDERLAVRDVTEDDVRWSAAREHGHPWVVSATFTVGGTERTARWTFDPSSREQHAMDDEALWLTQDDSAPDIWEVPGDYDVSAVTRPVLAAVDAPPRPAPDPTSVLLDDLHMRRGVRSDPRGRQDSLEGTGRPQPVSSGRVQVPTVRLSDDAGPGAPSEDEPPAGARVLQLQRPAAPGSRDRDADERASAPASPPEAAAEHAAEPEHRTQTGDQGRGDQGRGGQGRENHPRTDAPEREQHAVARREDASGDEAPSTPSRVARAGRKPARKGRAGVPSWDDILFGAKQD
ncbi:Protein of unknown function (DUF3071) [Sediminihabitans luteus]|uniref:DUF3071 domain-containing protein n=1 Tax=Sediminihabitans luteus TaxID=1138585 RepID=A0A2M9CQ75_9CELL|nr:septation protein SepH [Sediminihabitans luteus]PJJ74082.1 Protein of unknown function (DUF3071) [Sediminihabitans luteus]